MAARKTETYRAARRNRAKKLKAVWRLLPRVRDRWGTLQLGGYIDVV